MKLKLDTNTLIVIVIIVFAVVFLILAVTNKWFEPKANRQKLNINPNDGNVNTDQSGEIDTTAYARAAENAYNRLSGWNNSGEYFISTANELMRFNNNELRLVVNEYEDLYSGDRNYPTLRSLINGEYLACGEWYWFWYTSESCELRRQLNSRLVEIGA